MQNWQSKLVQAKAEFEASFQSVIDEKKKILKDYNKVSKNHKIIKN